MIDPKTVYSKENEEKEAKIKGSLRLTEKNLAMQGLQGLIRACRSDIFLSDLKPEEEKKGTPLSPSLVRFLSFPFLLLLVLLLFPARSFPLLSFAFLSSVLG